jgi:topoisomerase IV subunit A
MAEEFKQIMKRNYLDYASYVILERAIPNIDGFKPVQRRLLHTLFKMDDGKFHKVSTVSGRTMAFHPHGEASINDALVKVANRGYLLDRQGNFGNIFTGDPAAAPRYIETRLLSLAKETLFNPDTTEFVPSYDGRNMEPVLLPSKIPILLMQGAEGIAVGMSTRVFSHNFVELLEAQIAIMEGKEFEILPDFFTGGLMDASQYNQGQGKIKLRATLSSPNEKTILIHDIPHSSSTESVIQSIDEAAKKGKIKIDSINDYTADAVEIEIRLPRGQYASETMEALYAFTDCEITLNAQLLVIKDGLPWETTVSELLHYNTQQTKDLLKKELEIEINRLQEKAFFKSLERIFIEDKIYKKIETAKTQEALHSSLEIGFKPYHKKLLRIPSPEDFERLLSIPIRRISKFDQEKNTDEIAALLDNTKMAEKNLNNLKQVTIKYIKNILKKYGKNFPRKTQIQTITQVDKKKLSKEKIKIGVDLEKSFVGTQIKSENYIECTNYDKLLLLFKDGSYKVINIPEKEYAQNNNSPLIFASVADKSTIFRVIYQDSNTSIAYAKRFIIKQFLLDKTYWFFEEGMKLEFLTTQEEQSIELQFKPKAKQKQSKLIFKLDSVLIKGVSAKGIRISPKEVKKIKLLVSK